MTCLPHGPIIRGALAHMVSKISGAPGSCNTLGARAWAWVRFMTKGRGVMPAAPARSVQIGAVHRLVPITAWEAESNHRR
jgi:hypothetical protein